MKLYEFEGHKILSKAGIQSPFFVLVKSVEEIREARLKLKFPIVAKVQILSGKRGKNGGIVIFSREAQLLSWAKEKLGSDFLGEKVKYLMLASKVDIDKEYYTSITYDTVSRMPIFIFSEAGGMDVEEMVHKGEDVVRVNIDPVSGPKKIDFRKVPLPFEFVEKLWTAFFTNDARLVEINPLAKCISGELIAIDSKVIIDDNGISRQKELEVIPKGATGPDPTPRELKAKKIDEVDYRGSAGSAFIELSGDIAVLASGGGASLLLMDSIIASGGKPANYTEYSGNPPREKVEKLTKITLEKKGLSGCLVCGAFANFTDIYETLSGFADALVKFTPKVKYPIVVRRGGPKQEQAYEMLRKLAKKEGFDIHLFGPETPISVAAKKIVELANEYKIKIGT